MKNYMGFMMVLSFALYTMLEAHFISVYLGRNYALFLLGLTGVICSASGSRLQRGCRIYRRNTGGRAGVFWDGKKRPGNRAVKKKRERYRE